MTNMNESKIQLMGNTPKCVHCHKLFSLKKMNEVQTSVAHETGLCPACQAKAEVLEQYKEVNDAVKIVANENGEVIAEVTATNETVTVQIASVKPAKQIKEILTNLVDNNQINDAMLASLCDKQYALKSLGGVKYAFLKEVDTTQDIRAQVKINGKARYSTKVMTICGKTVVMTNDIYQKHLPVFQEWAKQFDLDQAC